uniref:Uncharacterized protein n=1 Tax=Neobodo designis TaxID=312471 RepID=A0A7S1QFC9_NEODS|eukprot:CAMPEP_0174851938 /NCGR_PEP_ID=MMETSP1114-20130205/24557_1 /TAXON_ID=312471 /ORGANISM="Neobodo designis, Strain CCAP 1951/1" /LENGTH=207 /DNA_ID=CAMNT_0016086505 /DNA_START=77 /DNA_END=700 /DNA_ORIENTATION=+
MGCASSSPQPEPSVQQPVADAPRTPPAEYSGVHDAPQQQQQPPPADEPAPITYVSLGALPQINVAPTRRWSRLYGAPLPSPAGAATSGMVSRATSFAACPTNTTFGGAQMMPAATSPDTVSDIVASSRTSLLSASRDGDHIGSAIGPLSGSEPADRTPPTLSASALARQRAEALAVGERSIAFRRLSAWLDESSLLSTRGDALPPTE